MATWTCTQCQVINPAHARACEGCGEDRARPSAPERPGKRCPADGAWLHADGWCPVGAGYVASATCPFACPICRHPLSWDGGCEACHGTSTGRREDWTFPGDRYELDVYDAKDDRYRYTGHWRKTLAGPRPACSPEENAQAAKILAGILAKRPPLADAPRRRVSTP